jgi:hypothetical protein
MDSKSMDWIDEDVDTTCNCKYMHGADEYESCWFDCTHPQRPALSCPYRKMKECSIAEPDTEEQDRQRKSIMSSTSFWEEYNKKDNYRVHICDVPEEVFYARHKHVLSLIGKYDARSIGLLIAGKYYRDVWSSRSCSGTLSALVNSEKIGGNGEHDYMDFYCESSSYYYLRKPYNEDLIKSFKIHAINVTEEFDEMDKLDGSSIS